MNQASFGFSLWSHFVPRRKGRAFIASVQFPPALLFLLGSVCPPPGAVLARDREGGTDKFGARPSAAADVVAGRLILLTCCVFGSCTIVVRTVV